MQGNESHTHIKPGVRVEVIDGSAAGAVGKVRQAWGKEWSKGIPLWLVTFDGLIRQRVLRQDFLRRVPT